MTIAPVGVQGAETLAAFAERDLHFFTFHNLLLECLVGVLELGGALGDAPFEQFVELFEPPLHVLELGDVDESDDRRDRAEMG